MELNNEEDNSDTERGDWKIQLVMQNNCISTIDFEETRTIYSASKPVQLFMGTDTDGTIDRLFDTLLQRFQQAIKTSNDRGANLPKKVLFYCIIIFRKYTFEELNHT